MEFRASEKDLSNYNNIYIITITILPYIIYYRINIKLYNLQRKQLYPTILQQTTEKTTFPYYTYLIIGNCARILLMLHVGILVDGDHLSLGYGGGPLALILAAQLHFYHLPSMEFLQQIQLKRKWKRKQHARLSLV